jgi:hypothetical protein
MRTVTLGRMPASSQASSELSTASFTVVSRAFRGLSNPSRWRFFAKNSETEISRCFFAIDSAFSRLELFTSDRARDAISKPSLATQDSE